MREETHLPRGKRQVWLLCHPRCSVCHIEARACLLGARSPRRDLLLLLLAHTFRVIVLHGRSAATATTATAAAATAAAAAAAAAASTATAPTATTTTGSSGSGFRGGVLRALRILDCLALGLELGLAATAAAAAPAAAAASTTTAAAASTAFGGVLRALSLYDSLALGLELGLSLFLSSLVGHSGREAAIFLRLPRLSATSHAMMGYDGQMGS